jgi:hypothetical protein
MWRMPARRRPDLVAIVVIWSCVLVVAFLLGSSSDDPGGWGETAGAVGWGLTAFYFYVRDLRNRPSLIRRSADRGSTDELGSTVMSWLKAMLAVGLWVAGSVILIAVGMQDGLAVLLGWLLPLAVFLVHRARRNTPNRRAPRTGGDPAGRSHRRTGVP